MGVWSLGVILRDSHGVAQVKLITGNKILRVLKAKGKKTWLKKPLFMGVYYFM